MLGGVSPVNSQRTVAGWIMQTDTTIAHELLHSFGGLPESAHDSESDMIFCTGEKKDDDANRLSKSEAAVLDSP